MLESSAREGFQGFVNKLVSVFNKGKDEVLKSSKISKARLDLSSLKKERRKAFERLGEEIYKRRKGLLISGFDSFFTEIDSINSRFASKERELKGLTEEEIIVTFPAEPIKKERPHRTKRKGPSLSEGKTQFERRLREKSSEAHTDLMGL